MAMKTSQLYDVRTYSDSQTILCRCSGIVFFFTEDGIETLRSTKHYTENERSNKQEPH
jgi:hypothetical protein